MRLRLIVIAVLVSLTAVVVAEAAPTAGSWRGQATNMDRDFKYGKVTFRVKGNTIRNLKIEGVTVDGCGGYKDVFVPKLTIKGTKFSGSYKPVADADDIIIVRGTITSRSAKATFTEGPLCEGAGRFTAKPR